MQTAFTVLLVLVLAGALVAFAVMALRQARRRNRLAKAAAEMRLRFAAEDPFDVPCRYGQFALISGGHSPRAHNVTYGRIGGVPVRAFDFRYEVGHGTRRLTRHYHVVALETGRELPEVLLWHEGDLAAAPPGARSARHRLGAWLCRGEPSLAGALAAACGPFADDGPSLQTVGQVVLLALPARAVPRGGAWRLELAEAVLGAVRPVGAEDGNAPARALQTPAPRDRN